MDGRFGNLPYQGFSDRLLAPIFLPTIMSRLAPGDCIA
jgi:hypothetical protein